VQVLVGFGANLGDPVAAFRVALAALGERSRLVDVSSLYRSAPHGPPQPHYLNLAALLDVDEPPLALLEHCQALEAAAGRDPSREQRWGPRVLDLDLLLAHGLVHRSPRLLLPHPLLAERAFALVPAAELAPTWVHPLVGRTIGELARAVDDPSLERVGRI